MLSLQTNISTFLNLPATHLTPNNQSLSAWPYALEEFVLQMHEFFNTRPDALPTRLIKRGYPHRFIKEEIEKLRHIPRSKALETSMKNQSNRMPFVLTFNPALPNISRIIFNNLNILRSSQRCKAAFPSPPLISYRRCSNLRDILVTEKGANRVLSLRREPRLTPFSLQMNNDKYDITSLVHLPISYT